MSKNNAAYPQFTSDVSTLLYELEERLENPYKHAYKVGEIVMGKAVGVAGTPRPPQTDQEYMSVNSCIENTRHIFEEIKELQKGNASTREISEKLEELYTQLKSDVCQQLPRIFNLFKIPEISRLFTYIQPVNNSLINAPTIIISDKKIRHLCYLFGRCGTQNLEEYIRLCMYGGPGTRNYIFNYSSIPYTELRFVPVEQRRYQSKNIAQIYKDVIKRNYPSLFEPQNYSYADSLPDEFILLQNDRYNNNEEHIVIYDNFMHHVQTKHSKLYNILNILKKVIIEQDIYFTQGQDTYLYYLYLMNNLNEENIQQIYNYIIKTKVIVLERGSSVFIPFCWKLFSELASKYKIPTPSDYTQKSLFYDNNLSTILLSIFGKNPASNNHNHPLFRKMMLYLFDLFIRTNSLFNVYLFASIAKYTKIYDEISSSEWETISRNSLDWLFEKQIAFNENSNDSVLFMKSSPFQIVLSMTMNMMLETIPDKLVNTSIINTVKNERYVDPSSTRYNMKLFLYDNYLLFNDIFAVHNILDSMLINFQERFQNPLKIGTFSKECITKGFIGVKGTPRTCASPNEFAKLLSCQKSIQNTMQQLMYARNALNYYKVGVNMRDVQTNIQTIRTFLQTLQTSESCQSFERLKTFSKNTSTGYEGDIALLNQYIDAITDFSSMPAIIDGIDIPIGSQGGYRKNHKKIGTLHKRRNANKKTIKRRKATRKRIQRHRVQRSMRR